MEEPDERFPKSVDFLPDERLSLSFLRSLQQNSSNSKIWVPRFDSLEDVEPEKEDVWDLHIGVIPTTDIETFIIARDGQIIRFEFENGGWIINEPTERDDIPGQLFAHMIKPYVEIERAVRKKKFEE